MPSDNPVTVSQFLRNHAVEYLGYDPADFQIDAGLANQLSKKAESECEPTGFTSEGPTYDPEDLEWALVQVYE